MQILARITKVDEATGKVYGRAVQEVPDRSGEIFDYASSKPNFEKWSTDMAKATDGKSVGNVRAMHGKVAAGKLTEITFADAEKAIDVCAEIVDPAEREKCIKGVYTGFSIGGRYVKKWTDGEDANLQRYTAEPTEISLVDLPCVPTAQFTVVKADGSEELRKFETTKDGVLEVRVTFDEVLQKLLDEDPDAMKHIMAKIAERKDTKPEEGEHKYGDVKFADEKNKKYPINTPAHIRAAWNYINKPKNAAKYDSKDLKTIKSKIVAAWKEHIDKNGPPSAEAKKGTAMSDSRAVGLFAKIDQAEPLLRTVRSAYGMPPLAKDLWNVSQLADLVSNLDCVTLCAENEANWEGDNSAVPGELRGVVKELAAILLDMADEEVEELVSAYEKADSDGDLSKVATTPENEPMNDEMKKALDDKTAELAKAADEMAKVVAERDELKKGIDERDAALVKAAAHIEKQAALIEKMKDQPEALKIALTAVAKGDDVTRAEPAKDEKVLKHDGSVDEVATELRKALRNPVMVR